VRTLCLCPLKCWNSSFLFSTSLQQLKASSALTKQDETEKMQAPAWIDSKAQYTPPTPTRLNCQVLSRVGGVNAPVSTWQSWPSLQFPVGYSGYCWPIEVGDKWRHNDVIVEKVINIDQTSRSQPAIESVWSVSELSTESVGSRRDLVANCVHSTVESRRRRRCVLGITIFRCAPTSHSNAIACRRLRMRCHSDARGQQWQL